VWISAILYFGIGIVVITIILAAGLPVINRLRDKNVIIQTKQVMHTIDDNIREVIREGPGSQRVVTINIKKGSFVIDQDIDGDGVGDNIVAWKYDNAKVLISEPGTPVPEGKLTVLTETAPVENTYNIQIYTDYNTLADIKKEGTSTLSGLSDLVIRNDGSNDEGLIQITIAETNR